MNFDTEWVQHEKQHGPQTLGAKEDAEFWFKKGVAHAEPEYDAKAKMVDDLHHQIEELKEQLSEYKNADHHDAAEN